MSDASYEEKSQQSKKKLYVNINNIPEKYSEKEIRIELNKIHFSPIYVHRMSSAILVALPTYEDSIFKLQELFGVNIEVTPFISNASESDNNSDESSNESTDLSERYDNLSYSDDKEQLLSIASDNDFQSTDENTGLPDLVLENGQTVNPNNENSEHSNTPNSAHLETPDAKPVNVVLRGVPRSDKNQEGYGADHEQRNKSFNANNDICAATSSTDCKSRTPIVKKFVDDTCPKNEKSFIYVVIKGIPAEIKEENILKDLKSKYFIVDAVYRMGDSDNKPTNKVALQISKDQDYIYYLSCCLGFEVRVESLRNYFSLVKNRHAFLKTIPRLFSDTPVTVLFRGIPMDIVEEAIQKDLKEKFFQPITIHRMKKPSQSGDKLLPMVIVQVPRMEEHIYDVVCILGFAVKAEEFVKRGYDVPQCQNCNQFGHYRSSFNEGIRTKTTQSPPLNAVVKGIPIEFDDNMVLEYLMGKSFTPIAIHRMVDGDEILPMYLVQVPNDQNRIFFLSCFLGFDVKVENLLPFYKVDQCEKCKQFGHEEKDCSKAAIKVSKETTICQKSKIARSDKVGNNFWDKANKLESTNNSHKNAKPNLDLEGQSSSSETCTAIADLMAPFYNLTHLNLGTSNNNEDVNLDDQQIGKNISEVESLFSQFLDSMIIFMKSLISYMMTIPNIPGVTSHTLNEQLHFLEEMEDQKCKHNHTPLHLPKDYDVHFPKLK